MEFNICNKRTRKRNADPPRKRRTDQFLDGSRWSQVFYIEIVQEERDEETEKCERARACLLPSFCDDVSTSASEIVHSTKIKCFYLRAANICILGGESSTLPVTLHTYFLTLLPFDMVTSLNFVTILPLLCWLCEFYL